MSAEATLTAEVRQWRGHVFMRAATDRPWTCLDCGASYWTLSTRTARCPDDTGGTAPSVAVDTGGKWAIRYNLPACIECGRRHIRHAAWGHCWTCYKRAIRERGEEDGRRAMKRKLKAIRCELFPDEPTTPPKYASPKPLAFVLCRRLHASGVAEALGCSVEDVRRWALGAAPPDAMASKLTELEFGTRGINDDSDDPALLDEQEDRAA